jgi:ABC-2 type transport system permease protein
MRFLAGKLMAVASLVLAAITVAFVLSCALAFPLASSRGIDTAAWTTGDGVLGALGEYVNVAGAALGWAAIGATLGLVLRSTGAAIGAGLAWILPAEAIIVANWSDATQWLPGRSIEAFAVGGTADVSYQHAAIVAAAYAAAFLAFAFAVFRRRDITS